jgi:hypothetical protein
MEHSMQRIHHVTSGVRVSESEHGSYYFVCKVGVWIEMRVRDGRFPEKKVGARWSIDHWKSHHEAFGCLEQSITQEEEQWRIDITNVVTTGWRDGSIGGPNGEQPSGNVWTLWGPNKNGVKCLPLGSVAPEFEFALFLEERGRRYWDNNLDRNFKILLADFGKPDLR